MGHINVWASYFRIQHNCSIMAHLFISPIKGKEWKPERHYVFGELKVAIHEVGGQHRLIVMW